STSEFLCQSHGAHMLGWWHGRGIGRRSTGVRMRGRPRRILIGVLAAAVLVAAGAALGAALRSGSASTVRIVGASNVTSDSRSAFLDDVAKRLGVTRSTLENALKAQALAGVNW